MPFLFLSFIFYKKFVIIRMNEKRKHMEKVMLIHPSHIAKKDIIIFRDEFLVLDESIHGSCQLAHYPIIDEWLSFLDDLTHKDKLPKDYVISTEYACVRESDRYLLGLVNIRHMLNEYLLMYDGHIGYSIRPSERRKGYGYAQLLCALDMCDTLGINPILITCNKDNEASRKTIIKAGGIKENDVVEDNGTIIERYWIHR